MYRSLSKPFALNFSVPRRRGDVPRTDFGLSLSIDCSPQTRGCTVEQIIQHCLFGLFPADAGMYRIYPTPHHCRAAVPRRRGDVPEGTASTSPRITCSPQTRGCTD